MVVSYPFHPLVGKSVLVVGDKEHAGMRHLIVHGPDGAKILLPEWMASPDAGAIRIVSHPRLCVNRLIELRAFVDRLMASSPRTKTLPEENNETTADVKTGSLQDVALRAASPQRRTAVEMLKMLLVEVMKTPIAASNTNDERDNLERGDDQDHR